MWMDLNIAFVTIILSGAILASVLPVGWHARHSTHSPTMSHPGWMDQPSEAVRRPSVKQSPKPNNSPPDGPILTRLVWESQPSSAVAGTSSLYPMLATLDCARGPDHEPFATSPCAAVLEQQARVLTDQTWSEMVWLTGMVDQARLTAVCDALERQRSAPDVSAPGSVPPTLLAR
jgi:hypothetical protein